MGIGCFGWSSYCYEFYMKSKKQIRKGVLTAKLTFFDWGWAD
ncbi:hypothetical protein LCGC14_0545750, partial [marine sediment metagenome]